MQLLGRDKIYGIETPGYDKIRAVYEANGAQCELLPLWARRHSPRRIAKITCRRAACHTISQFSDRRYGARVSPVGVPCVGQAARGAVLIEDDFDSEFAARGLPLETLYSMDGGQNVIYLNTFSKSLSPSMRIGYMVLPERLREFYEERLGFYSCTVPAFDQYLLAEYISRGYFERHLNRLRKRLRETREY